MSIADDLTALRVGPDEVLIVRLPEDSEQSPDDWAQALDDVGLAGRALVIVGDDVQLAVVKKDAP